MTDVAARAGVSHQTVSRVVNGFVGIRPETRARVLAAIEELGYRRNLAARMLASSRSGVIGVVSWGSGLYGPSSVVTALEEAALRRGYDISVVTLRDFGDESVSAAFERLLSQAVEALVLVVPHHATTRGLERGAVDVPVVTVLGDTTGSARTAALDNVGGARAAVRHLLDLGHRTVEHVAGPDDFGDATARAEGWRAELEAAGREVPPVRWQGDWSARSGYAAGVDLAGDEDVTAVFVGNDQMALGVVRALLERGRRVPEDVSVVGFDDLPEAAYFTPPLTTVRQEFALLGQTIMSLLERTLAGESEPHVPLVSTNLVVRASTAAPPAR
ncbi:MAG: Transcriptional regulator, LacI family [uncultured Nocardioidaceae bacterium]|uniref:Transcriptional regulator, LacI family n=1 Tax=uncultured Nocardioidaceae bacterium TaxID=253824 RepID=A0A6J4M594_9ACTN|nr:MAG: Transcriptional regulator, LacI family [uncultured Nocardioidaceae bacterium]